MSGAHGSARPKLGRASIRVACALGAILALAPAAAAPASFESAPDDLAVATRIIPPFVIAEKDGRLTGFSIDLWRAIATESGLKSHFQVYDTLPELLGAVQTGLNPVGIGATSITAERAKVLEFSEPMFRSGLQIMAPAGESSVLDAARAVLSLRLLAAIGVFLLALLVPAHIAWAIHRTHPESTWDVSRSYWPGILEAFYWSGEKMIGTAMGAPGGHAGRLFNNAWSFLCVMVLASLTALIASALTVNSLRSEINGPEDLSGKRIATVSGSTSATYLRDIGAYVEEYPNFEDAAAALARAKPSDRLAPVALVYDAPIVLYYINKDPDHRFRTVGGQFRAENYGIAFPLDTKIRHTVDMALLKISENGVYEQIREKWFGKSTGQD